MKKTKKWRAIRQQERREKARMYKLHKADRDAIHREVVSQEDADAPVLGVFGNMMLNALHKARLMKPDIDRRNMNRTGHEQGGK